MKTYIRYALLFALATISVSCEDWLDATASSEIREKDHYSTEEGFRQSLIGCYINMTDPKLYGKELSWFLPEILARQFSPYTTAVPTAEYYLQNYSYQATGAVTRVEEMWAQAYNVIVNANAALAEIDARRGVLEPINYNVFKGELLAIRAYMHFDLIRLFGYGNWAGRPAEVNAKYAVPYLTTVNKKQTPQLSMEDFFKQLTADLAEAARLLEDDPITGKHEWSEYTALNEEGFYNYRNLHLNYFAVRALQARVYLWEGSLASKKLALEAAEEVIRKFFEQDGKMGKFNVFRWMGAEETASYPALALEQIFALNINGGNFTSYTAAYLKPNYQDTDLSAFHLTPEAATELYENSNSDYRFTKLLNFSSSAASLQGYAPTKLEQSRGLSLYSNRIPMIRMSEMYYIAAECYATGSEPDLALAIERLTTVRRQRGVFEELDPAMDAEAIMDEIRKEYRKEFLCEGVVFYLYKRFGQPMIPNYDKEMTDKQYVLPYPEYELRMGRVQ
ncbi:RagB/SusD family nutrient uptake outer membrane protein [Alistipes sp.]|uniref:RagB/SusD family nutrient uptake outer membrane protein n=1 Tax=Alistipes sp. TaxID=1872444 RepID=UPI003AF1CF5E